jgi:hypothetical protein
MAKDVKATAARLPLVTFQKAAPRLLHTELFKAR